MLLTRGHLMERDNACHDYGVFSKEAIWAKPKASLFVDHKKRSLPGQSAVEPVLEFSAHGRRPTVVLYRGKIQQQWFEWPGDALRTMSIRIDFAWFLCRLNTTSTFSSGPLLQNDQHPLPSWSAFNDRMSSHSPPVTSVGYCPMINALSTEYSTIYTLIKNAQKIMVSL